MHCENLVPQLAAILYDGCNQRGLRQAVKNFWIFVLYMCTNGRFKKVTNFSITLKKSVINSSQSSQVCCDPRVKDGRR